MDVAWIEQLKRSEADVFVVGAICYDLGLDGHFLSSRVLFTRRCLSLNHFSARCLEHHLDCELHHLQQL